MAECSSRRLLIELMYSIIQGYIELEWKTGLEYEEGDGSGSQIT
jgi:hypothetical protein